MLVVPERGRSALLRPEQLIAKHSSTYSFTRAGRNISFRLFSSEATG